jgi:hypothetical protein
MAAEALATLNSGIHLVTSVPLPGQLDPSLLAAAVRAAATHPAVRLTVLDYGSCPAATKAFKDSLRWAVAGVLPAGRVGIYQDPQFIAKFPTTAAYFSSSTNPSSDGFVLPAKDRGLTVFLQPTFEEIRDFVARRAAEIAAEAYGGRYR